MSCHNETQERDPWEYHLTTVLEKPQGVTALVFSAKALLDVADRRPDRTARLHNPIQIRAEDSVFEILAKLEQVGLQVAINDPRS